MDKNPSFFDVGLTAQVHGVLGRVQGEGRAACAAALRPRFPRIVHRHVAEAPVDLPGLPLLPPRLP